MTYRFVTPAGEDKTKKTCSWYDPSFFFLCLPMHRHKKAEYSSESGKSKTGNLYELTRGMMGKRPRTTRTEMPMLKLTGAKKKEKTKKTRPWRN
jgi:hypothetical protein